MHSSDAMDIGTDGDGSSYPEFLNRLYGGGGPPQHKIAIELDVMTDGGGVGSDSMMVRDETSHYDTFEFLLNTVLEGFARLGLPPPTDNNIYVSIGTLQRYFDALSMRIVCRPVEADEPATAHWCVIGLNAAREPRLVKNPFYYSEGNRIHALYGRYAISFLSL